MWGQRTFPRVKCPIVSEQHISPHIQFDITKSLPTYNIAIGIWYKCLSTLCFVLTF